MSSVSDYLQGNVLLGVGLTVVGLVGVKMLLTDNGGRQKLLAQRKIQQTVEVAPGKKGEGGVRRNAEYKDALLTQWDPKITTFVEMFDSIAAKNPSRPFLGRRTQVGKTAGPYEFLTYGDIKQRRDNLGSGIASLGLAPKTPVGIYSINRPEWIISDLACSAYGYPSVALYDTLGPDSVEFIINHAEISVILTSSGKQLKTILATKKKCPNLKTIISFDPITEEEKNEAKQNGVEIFQIQDIEAKGKQNPQNKPTVVPDDIYTIMYTSGTTGNPKGVVLTHKAGIAEVSGVRGHQKNLFSQDDVHMSYLPLAHSFERAVAYTIVSFGAQIGFFQGIITELFNDIAELKPTFLVGAPRVWNRLHDKLLHTINNSGGVRRTLFQWGYAAKKTALENGTSASFWDTILFSKIKMRLGGRVKWILSGSAPLDPKLGEFLKICFGCPILEGYGLTETFAGAFITRFDETQFGHVGMPLGCSEVKLRDVPEMDYYANANPPKGEILIRGPNNFREYYKDKKQTSEVLEDDGWFSTGDVGRWNENGTLSIVDRKKNIFKLEQGEYVAVEYLEGVYQLSKYVAQIWVYGSSFKRYLVAIVVPDQETLLPWAKERGIQGSYTELCQNSTVKQEIITDLTKCGKEHKLNGFEFVKAITLISDPFSVDNDTMTPTFKLRRPQLLKRFQKEVDSMYAEIEAQEQSTSS